MQRKKTIRIFGKSVLVIAVLLLLSAASIAGTYADTPDRAVSANASVNVSLTCTMTGNVTSPHSTTLTNGTYKLGVGNTQLKAFCNDAAGFSIYAVGYTGDTRGNNKLVNASLGSDYDITTGTTLDGTTSNWAMKVDAVSGTYQPAIQNNFDSYHTVPTTYTKVAKYNNTTDRPATSGVGSSVTTTYGISVSPTQPSGSYTGQVKYMLVHPSTAAAPDAYSMQDVDDWKGQILVGEEVQVYDERDSKSYTAARLCVEYSGSECVDSQIWMTQNLDFLPDTTRTYTHADTDLGYTTSDTSATWKPADSLATPATISSFTSGSHEVLSGWTNSASAPYIAEGGDTYAYNGSIYTSLSDCELYHTESDCLHYHIGNYYNWTTSVASNNSSSYTADPTVAPDSICPAGWRLPKGLTSDGSMVTQSEFNKLLLANGIAAGSDTTLGTTTTNVNYASGGFNKMIAKPYYFVRSGYVVTSTLYRFSTGGGYWSSSAQSGSFAYGLYFRSGGLWPAGRYDRVFGRSVRCVAR